MSQSPIPDHDHDHDVSTLADSELRSASFQDVPMRSSHSFDISRYVRTTQLRKKGRVSSAGVDDRIARQVDNKVAGNKNIESLMINKLQIDKIGMLGRGKEENELISSTRGYWLNRIVKTSSPSPRSKSSLSTASVG